MMLQSREDLTMVEGPIMVGGGRHPWIQRCALCGGGADGRKDDKIIHAPSCVLAPASVTHVKMIGVRHSPKAKPDVLSGWCRLKARLWN